MEEEGEGREGVIGEISAEEGSAELLVVEVGVEMPSAAVPPWPSAFQYKRLSPNSELA